MSGHGSWAWLRNFAKSVAFGFAVAATTYLILQSLAALGLGNAARNLNDATYCTLDAMYSPKAPAQSTGAQTTVPDQDPCGPARFLPQHIADRYLIHFNHFVGCRRLIDMSDWWQCVVEGKGESYCWAVYLCQVIDHKVDCSRPGCMPDRDLWFIAIPQYVIGAFGAFIYGEVSQPWEKLFIDAVQLLVGFVVAGAITSRLPPVHVDGVFHTFGPVIPMALFIAHGLVWTTLLSFFVLGLLLLTTFILKGVVPETSEIAFASWSGCIGTILYAATIQTVEGELSRGFAKVFSAIIGKWRR